MSGPQLIVLLLVLQDGDIIEQLNEAVQKLEFFNRYRLDTFTTTVCLVTLLNTITLVKVHECITNKKPMCYFTRVVHRIVLPRMLLLLYDLFQI